MVMIWFLILSILISSCNPSADTVVKYIEPEELKKWQAENREFILVDVRGPEPFLEEHIEGAVPLPSFRGYNIYILNAGYISGRRG